MRRARRKAKKQQSDERSNKVGCRLGAAALALRSRPDVRDCAGSSKFGSLIEDPKSVPAVDV